MSQALFIVIAASLYGLTYALLHVLVLASLLSIEANRVINLAHRDAAVARLTIDRMRAQHAADLDATVVYYRDLVNQQASEVASQVAAARVDSVKRSKSVIRGQATEHLAPLLMEGFNPKDVRWCGLPIDYVVFHGLSDVIDGVGESISIYLIDTKTGKSQLSKTQRRIRDAVVAGRVVFGVFTPDTKELKEYRYVEPRSDGISLQTISIPSEVAWEVTRDEPVPFYSDDGALAALIR